MAFGIIGCSKNDGGSNNQRTATTTPDNFKLKFINYPVNITILLSGNDTVFSQSIEYFTYTSNNLLSKRYLISGTKNTAPAAFTYDTAATYTYSYNTAGLMVSYTQKTNAGIFNHILDYDVQNRLVRDSVSNPVVSNNKVTTFTYQQDTVFTLEKQTFPIGLQVIVDTIVMNNGVTIKMLEKITPPNGNPYFKQYGFTATNYQNPLALLSNVELFSSDYRNGSATLYFSGRENISKNLSSQISEKYWYPPQQPTQYSGNFLQQFDAQNRVISIIEQASGLTTKQFIYY